MDLKLSKEVINRVIMASEVGYQHPGNWNAYNRTYCRPCVPDPQNTDSGVTIGIGYDCGQVDAQTILSDWQDYIPLPQAQRLAATAGLTKQAALDESDNMQDIVIPIDAALKQWYDMVLPDFARKTAGIYPNISNLHPYEQTCLISLVFNRGTSLTGDRRKEMRDLVDATNRGDDQAMGQLFRDMKRLWPDTKGLRIRRDLEADFIEMANDPIPADDELTLQI